MHVVCIFNRRGKHTQINSMVCVCVWLVQFGQLFCVSLCVNFCFSALDHDCSQHCWLYIIRIASHRIVSIRNFIISEWYTWPHRNFAHFASAFICCGPAGNCLAATNDFINTLLDLNWLEAVEISVANGEKVEKKSQIFVYLFCFCVFFISMWHVCLADCRLLLLTHQQYVLKMANVAQY